MVLVQSASSGYGGGVKAIGISAGMAVSLNETLQAVDDFCGHVSTDILNVERGLPEFSVLLEQRLGSGSHNPKKNAQNIEAYLRQQGMLQNRYDLDFVKVSNINSGSEAQSPFIPGIAAANGSSASLRTASAVKIIPSPFVLQDISTANSFLGQGEQRTKDARLRALKGLAGQIHAAQQNINYESAQSALAHNLARMASGQMIGLIQGGLISPVVSLGAGIAVEKLTPIIHRGVTALENNLSILREKNPEANGVAAGDQPEEPVLRRFLNGLKQKPKSANDDNLQDGLQSDAERNYPIALDWQNPDELQGNNNQVKPNSDVRNAGNKASASNNKPGSDLTIPELDPVTRLALSNSIPKILARRNSDPGISDAQAIPPINNLSFWRQMDYFIRGDKTLSEQERKAIVEDRELNGDRRRVEAVGGLLGPIQRWAVEKTTGVDFGINHDPTEGILNNNRLTLRNDKHEPRQLNSGARGPNSLNNNKESKYIGSRHYYKDGKIYKEGRLTKPSSVNNSNLPALPNQGNIDSGTSSSNSTNTSTSATNNAARGVQGFNKPNNNPGDLVGSNNARGVVLADPLITRRYIRQIENITQKAVTTEQVGLLKNALQTQEFKKLSLENAAKHRNKFDNIKSELRKEWKQNTGKEWPVYKTHSNPDKIGKPYDAHHIIQLNHEGPNTWWNIHPAHGLTEHKIIHGSGSVANEIFKPKKK